MLRMVQKRAIPFRCFDSISTQMTLIGISASSWLSTRSSKSTSAYEALNVLILGLVLLLLLDSSSWGEVWVPFGLLCILMDFFLLAALKFDYCLTRLASKFDSPFSLPSSFWNLDVYWISSDYSEFYVYAPLLVRICSSYLRLLRLWIVFFRLLMRACESNCFLLSCESISF